MNLKDKLVALAFLVRAMLYITKRILTSRTWNMIIVDLEDAGEDGLTTKRSRITYRRTANNYILEDR